MPIIYQFSDLLRHVSSAILFEISAQENRQNWLWPQSDIHTKCPNSQKSNTGAFSAPGPCFHQGGVCRAATDFARAAGTLWYGYLRDLRTPEYWSLDVGPWSFTSLRFSAFSASLRFSGFVASFLGR